MSVRITVHSHVVSEPGVVFEISGNSDNIQETDLAADSKLKEELNGKLKEIVRSETDLVVCFSNVENTGRETLDEWVQMVELDAPCGNFGEKKRNELRRRFSTALA